MAATADVAGTRRTVQAAWIAAGMLAAAGMPAWAANMADEVSETPAREREMVFHLRTYYLERDKPAGQSDLLASTAGGWIGYDSGWFFDRIRFGLVGYTSQKLDGPLDKDGTLLLKPDQKSFGGLGEANARIKLWDDDSIFTVYRQKVYQPEVNPRDIRMTPNTFEGYTASGKVASVGYYGGYIDKIKPINATGFIDMAKQANAATTVTSGMWLGGLSYAPIKDLTLRYSGYQVQNILNSNYVDAVWLTPLSEKWKLRLSGNYMFQSSTGSNALTGASFNTWAGGLKGDFLYGGATMRMGYTQTGRGSNYNTPYGSWAGYTSMVVTDFNRAKENAFLFEGSYDFAAMNVPGLVITAYGVFGGNAVSASTGARVSDKTEYNATLDYRFSGDWPDWMKPLWLRARATRIDEDVPGGSNTTTKDYRFIVNYEQKLNW